jgi:hypothetical protein
VRPADVDVSGPPTPDDALPIVHWIAAGLVAEPPLGSVQEAQGLRVPR